MCGVRSACGGLLSGFATTLQLFTIRGVHAGMLARHRKPLLGC
jgi:hypothetical protein